MYKRIATDIKDLDENKKLENETYEFLRKLNALRNGKDLASFLNREFYGENKSLTLERQRLKSIVMGCVESSDLALLHYRCYLLELLERPQGEW